LAEGSRSAALSADALGHLSTISADSITVQGGETLVYPAGMDFLCSLKNRQPTAWLHLVTNGVLIEQNIEALRAASLDRIDVSVDAASAATYKAIRGGQLTDVLNGIRLLKEGPNPPDVRVLWIAMRSNIEELMVASDVFAPLGVSGVRVDPLCRGADEAMCDSETLDEDGEARLRDIATQAPSGFLDFSRVFIDESVRRPVCPAFYSGALVDVDGAVKVCCGNWNHIGNINDTPLPEILDVKMNDVLTNLQILAVQRRYADAGCLPHCTYIAKGRLMPDSGGA
jgi:MoaA/NifB/PqqE/SkfB family radical SAM enzyme